MKAGKLNRAAWSGTVEDFLNIDQAELLLNINELSSCSSLNHDEWMDSIDLLSTIFTDLCDGVALARKWWLIFEYELPREESRRPNLCILTEKCVIVTDIQVKGSIDHADVNRCKAFVRDIQEYHVESRTLKVHGVVLALWYQGFPETRNLIHITGPTGITEIFKNIPGNPMTYENHRQWLDSLYEPLPSLVVAAKKVFAHEPLPIIRQANRAGFPKTLGAINDAIEQARKNNDKRLVLIRGTPGAGKTFVGIRFVHTFSSKDNDCALFLSGNNALIKVLQHALNNRVFVQDIHSFIYLHGIKDVPLTNERVLVFDEAQRAWSSDKVHAHYFDKKQLDIDCSEHELFIKVAARREGWAIVICLIGEGQEIYSGEEGSIGLWNDAIAASGIPWTVHCSPELTENFKNCNLVMDVYLDLMATLRSHSAIWLSDWVDMVLKEKFAAAAELSRRIIENGFSMFITDDLAKAKSYMIERYKYEPGKTYGIIASSQAANLKEYGLYTDHKSRQRSFSEKIGMWYNDPESDFYCRTMRQLATEFECQGLELDGTIIAWGDDMVWAGKSWISKTVEYEHLIKEPHRLRINSYRVLLTRARDGFVIFCPQRPEMRQTYQVLLDSGLKEL